MIQTADPARYDWRDQKVKLYKFKRLLEGYLALEDLLFARGAMNQAPCFCCGYDGAGFFQPDQHPCAKRHHELYHG